MHANIFASEASPDSAFLENHPQHAPMGQMPPVDSQYDAWDNKDSSGFQSAQVTNFSIFINEIV